MTSVGLAEAFAAFGRSAHDLPRAPVLHGPAGTLVTFALPGPQGGLDYTGVWIQPTGTRFLGPAPTPTGGSEVHGLTGTSAGLFDLFVGSARVFLERVEEIDARLAEAQERGRSVPLSEVWALQRRTAQVRAQIGRALVGLSELSTRFAANFPDLPGAVPTIVGEIGRVQNLAANVQQSLSDLILLRNAEESNRIAEAANELSRTSNRIASFANTSNIRMLGITYLALVLGLVSAVVLIPNTGATILGMPSAAWVPGLWVDVILVVLAIVPMVVVFSRPWVKAILTGLTAYEGRAREGLTDLPELEVPPSKRPPPSR